MSNLAIKLLPEPVYSLGFASISGTYASVGSGLLNPSRLLIFQNLTNANIMLSWDGVHDHMPLSANAAIIMDVMTNKSNQSGALSVQAGQKFYIKEIGTPTSGTFYITSFYGANG